MFMQYIIVHKIMRSNRYNHYIADDSVQRKIVNGRFLFESILMHYLPDILSVLDIHAHMALNIYHVIYTFT